MSYYHCLSVPIYICCKLITTDLFAHRNFNNGKNIEWQHPHFLRNDATQLRLIKRTAVKKFFKRSEIKNLAPINQIEQKRGDENTKPKHPFSSTSMVGLAGFGFHTSIFAPVWRTHHQWPDSPPRRLCGSTRGGPIPWVGGRWTTRLVPGSIPSTLLDGRIRHCRPGC